MDNIVLLSPEKITDNQGKSGIQRAYNVAIEDEQLRIFTLESEILLLSKKSTYKLAHWLNDNILKKYKTIQYQDRSYDEKRKVLRDLSIKDEIKQCLDIITDKVYDKITEYYDMDKNSTINKLDLYHFIKNFLVDGYLSFEIIYDENNTIIDLSIVDPITLMLKQEGDKKFFIQYAGSENERIIEESRIIYLSYLDSATSYVEELKPFYDNIRKFEAEFLSSIISSSMIDKKYSHKNLKMAHKNFIKASRIPKNYFKNEYVIINGYVFDKFIDRLFIIFKEGLFDVINYKQI